ncbi:hypothetical protein BRADI_3g43696v3 [Brachypodium distachyon]|uniref:Uncharacterized protein n=1 Tax=Brachypodium distachyon TaxID=15368 RepID=A0A0Q3IFU4_BRADI|nr:hypothetical protein BRADI_3g43696v3 [Brachypodium distachyon]
MALFYSLHPILSVSNLSKYGLFMPKKCLDSCNISTLNMGRREYLSPLVLASSFLGNVSSKKIVILPEQIVCLAYSLVLGVECHTLCAQGIHKLQFY